MSRWYTTYDGYNWTPEKGYSDLFKRNVRVIREWFHLKKTSIVGVEVASGVWKPYTFRGNDVLVIIDRFEWMHQTREGNVAFQLKIRVAKKSNFWTRLLGRASPVRVIFKEQITMTFPDNYPNSPPLFRVDNPGYQGISQLHEHHIFSGGIMCILADRNDWNPNVDSVLRAINAAIEWIVWHQGRWGNSSVLWR